MAEIYLRIAALQHSLLNLKTEEESVVEASLQAQKLPSEGFAENLIRYEAALEKRKEKTIKLLMMLKGK